MNTWEDFEQEARAVEEYTKNEVSEIVRLLQEAVGIFADAFSVGEESDTTDATLAKMSLLSQNLATLKCSVDLAVRGYYTQSLNLLRIVYENWIAFRYLSKYPSKADLWLRHSKKKQPPGHAAMLTQLGSDNPLEDQMRKWYKALCRFAHTGPVGVLPQISTDYIPGEKTVHFGSTYKDNLFMSSACYISKWTGIMLVSINQFVPNANQWHKEMINIINRIIKFTDQEEKAYGSEKI